MARVQTGYKRAKSLKIAKKHMTPEQRTLFAQEEEKAWRAKPYPYGPGELLPPKTPQGEAWFARQS